MTARAYYDEEHRCWMVPVSCEMWQQAEEGKLQPIEPVRLELRDGQLWITRLEQPPSETVSWIDPLTGQRASSRVLGGF
jgi:hypothetical protein